MRAATVATAGLLLVMAGLAGCSSANTSSVAVQDEVAASSSVPAMSSSAGSGSADADAGASASPDSPASVSGSSGTTEDLGATAPDASGSAACGSGLAYACGDIGPGGGTVFYAVATPFRCGPKGGSSTCNFLEAAANPWDPNSEHACPGTPCGGGNQTTSDFSFSGKGISWCTGLGRNDYVSNTYDTIGSGFQNTAYMNTMCGAGSASQAASAYQGGGLDDWYLPSKDELNVLYLYPNRAAIGGFNSGRYWTSSAGYPLGRAWIQVFSDGTQDSVQAKGNTYGVRPIRAF